MPIRARRSARSSPRRSSSRPCSTRSRPAGSSSTLGPRARRRGEARAPRRGAVPPARAGAALGGRARAWLRRLRATTLAELGGAEQIVEEHLERALAGLDDDERDLVARLFNHLVTPSGTKIAHAVDDLARYAGDDRQSGSSRCSAPSTPRASCVASPAEAAGRRGTRSSTTCSRPPCSPGAPRTRLERRLATGGPRRRDGTGGWPRSLVRSPSSHWRGTVASCRLGALAAAEARDLATHAEARELVARRRSRSSASIPSSASSWPSELRRRNARSSCGTSLRRRASRPSARGSSCQAAVGRSTAVDVSARRSHRARLSVDDQASAATSAFVIESAGSGGRLAGTPTVTARSPSLARDGRDDR